MSTPLILLVEDDVVIREVMKDLLETEQYRVALADRDTALEQAKDLQPDVILLDLYMPRLTDGETVSHQLEEEPTTVDIPVMLTSAVDNLSMVAKRLHRSFLMKPFTLQLLIHDINPLIAAHRAHRAEHAPPP